jgi:hypothetical protein
MDGDEPSAAVVDVTVKAGPNQTLVFPALASSTRVSQLKQLIEDRTSTFARRQKLIFKGKVLADDATLGGVAGGGGGGSITLMLLAAPPNAGAGAPTRGAAAVAAAAAAAAEARLERAARQGGGGADSRGAPAAAAATTKTTWRARRDVWGKAGIIALRDAGASEALALEAAAWAREEAAAEEEQARGGRRRDGAGAAPVASPCPHARLFAGLAPVAGPRAMDLSGNPGLRALPRAVLSPAPLRAALRSLRLASCGLTTEGVPWAWLPPGLTALALDGNAIDRVPRELSELPRLGAGDDDEEEEEEEEEGAGEPGQQQQPEQPEEQRRRRPRPRKKLGRLALLTLSRNRITHFEPGALDFGGGGGDDDDGEEAAAATESAAAAAGGPAAPPPPAAPSLRALDVSFNAVLASLPWEDMAAGALASLVELDARGNRIRALEPPPPPPPPPATATATAVAPPPPPPPNPLSHRMPALRSLRLESNLVRAPLPDSLFGRARADGAGESARGGGQGRGAPAAAPPCPSLSLFSLDDNPITAQEMRAAAGWAAFDARRVAAASKRIESGVLLGRGTFAEGADAAEWERYK